jgi:D-glycerate 3-kinase
MHNGLMTQVLPTAASLAWADAGLQRFLAAHALPADYALDVAAHFLPLAAYLKETAASSLPLFVGINGAQGTGKSTLATLLQQVLQDHGLRVASLSLDDFYLPRSARAELARTVHPLLAVRGVPGTHDTGLLAECLESLRALASGSRVSCPQFDKAADDRATEPLVIEGPLDIVLLEGWCVGTPPEHSAALVTAVNALERYDDANGRWRRYVNERLGSDYRDLFRELDLLIYLRAPGLAEVRRWRLEQEQKLRERGATLMSDEEVITFVQYFERLTLAAFRALPDRADVVLTLDAQHRCTASHYRQA